MQLFRYNLAMNRLVRTKLSFAQTNRRFLQPLSNNCTHIVADVSIITI